MSAGLTDARRLRLVALLAGSLVVIAVSIHVLRSVEGPDAERASRAGGMAASDDAGTAAEGIPVAATRAPTSGRPSSDSAAEAPPDRPVAPDGYSLARHHGRMAKGGAIAATAATGSGPDWLRSPDAVDILAARAVEAGRDWTFGYAELAPGASREALERSLAGLGGRMVGASGRLIRARLPGDGVALEAITALDEVSGLGAVPREVKLAGFGGSPEAGQPDGDLRVFVTLMEDDAGGAWGRELEAAGAALAAYDADTRAWTATALPEVVRELAGLDFVAAVEPVGEVRAMNDTAVPAMGADALYTLAGPAGVFSGKAGASVPVGVMDTGLNLNHPDIRENRDSICGAYFAFAQDEEDARVEEEDLWIDEDNHGTHVTGTILGGGVDEPRFAGMAPGVKHIRFAKVLHRSGRGSGEMIRRGMDWLALDSECGGAAARPLVVNMSLSNNSRYWEGRSVAERKVDATVWKHGQLYVVSQSNAGESSFSNYGSAKNTLSVGAVHDTGGHATFTSLGPTRDGRLAPQLSGTGVHVHSARGGGSPGGYERLNGTSMAAPSVAGVAALLMDAVPAHQGNPALTRARLMASAIRPDAWLEDPAAFPLDNSGGPGSLQNVYGLGKASARTAALDRDAADGWRSGSVVAEPEDGEYAYVDIDVPAGASRLDLVMTWDEPPADTISTAVLNDLDLWLDRDADCGGAECGEHSSTSRIDNVEWIVVRNPTPGTYRAKVAARAVYTAAPQAALAWTVIRGPSTPQLRVDANPRALGADAVRDIRVSVEVDGYVAAGTRLAVDCRGEERSIICDGVEIESAAVALEDGSWRELEIPESLVDLGLDPDEPLFFGAWFSLGELAAGETTDVRLRVRTGADPALLRLAVDAWNAAPAVTLVDIGGGVARESTSPNDDFENAEEIEGAEGSVELDLFAATAETGEPGLASPPFVRRPASSVWYRWTAPSSEIVHFGIGRPGGAASEHARVAAFEGDLPTSLAEVADDRFNVSFQAEEGRPYRIRAASFERSEDLELRWSTGRPANDDFAAAAQIEGASGEIDVRMAGATLERGESWGSLAGTVWYRWTAPEDGVYSFQTVVRYEDRGFVSGPRYIPNVMVFRAANDFGKLRLAATFPYHADRYFTARGGESFRIAAAHRSEQSSFPFTLEWRRTILNSVDNDAFAEADALAGTTSSTAEIHVDRDSTVEPGEPGESGVRTRWWKWEAPEDGRFTWRLEHLLRDNRGHQLQVRAFAGNSLEELDLVGAAGPLAPREFAVDVAAGETLHLAAGFPAEGPDAFVVSYAEGELEWGPTPVNDGMARAAVLDSAYGALSGSNRFATTDLGVRTDVVGRSAVWWMFEAPEDGWYRFSADGDGGPWALTVFDGDGVDMMASSRWQRAEGNGAAVLFYAEAGSRHAVSLGTVGGGTDGGFTLRWDTADPPLWLRYAGRLADGYRDGRDQPVEIRMPGELVFGGEALYLASGLGLSVFERDRESGGLSFVQLVDDDLEHASLAWDGDRSRLLAHDCGRWRSFEIEGGGPQVAAPADLSVADDPGRCGRLLVHREGTFAYRIGESGIDVFAVEDGGGLRFAHYHEGYYLEGAALSGAGLLYGSSGAELIVLQTDAETGELTRTAVGAPLASPRWQDDPLVAAGEDGTLLFVYDGEATHAFSLEDPLDPERLATLPRTFGRENPWGDPTSCVFAAGRGDSAVDVFCEGAVSVAEWRSGEQTLVEAERVEAGVPDRFNRLVPEFGKPVGMAASADGRHVYVSTTAKGIQVFERVATPEESDRLALPDGPDLVVVSASVDDPTPLHGRLFRFHATVRNRGSTGSDSSTLRFHRSSDATIDADDDEVATRYVRRLAAGDDADLSSSIRAPASAGTYYYGVCVDAVDEESDTANNCSQGVEIRVTAPDLVVVTPAVDDATPEAGESFTLSVTVRNRGDGRSIGAGRVQYYRSADAEIATDDAEVGTDVVGSLQPGAESDESIRLTAPSGAGTYYYGACVDAVDGESDTTNNCSTGVQVEVSDEEGGSTDDHGGTFADATSVAVPSTTDGELEEGGDRDYFTLVVDTATTLTVGTTGSTDTYGTLFDGNETSLDTDDDGGAGANFEIERDVDAGTYYVEVRGVSTSTTGTYQLEVSASDDGGGGGSDSYCRPDDVVQPGEECEIYDTSFTFDVDSDGRGCFRAGGFLSCSGNGISMRNRTINGVRITFVADRNSDDSWTIDDVDPVPDDGGGGGGSADDVFGALSFNLISCTDVPVGLALDRNTEQAALDAAVDACEDDGGSRSGCRDKSKSFQRCGVITHALLPGVRCVVQGWANRASSRSAAESTALSGCRRENPGFTCTVLDNEAGENMSGCNSTSSSSSATVSETATTTAVRSIRSASIDDR